LVVLAVHYVGLAGSLKYEHHFGLDCIVGEHMALQASLMHSINGVSLGASALIAGARLRGTTCFAGRVTEAVLGDRLSGIIWFAEGRTETVFGSFEHPATASTRVAARNRFTTLLLRNQFVDVG
jgi:hypothetical protein